MTGPPPVSVHGTLTAASVAAWSGQHHHHHPSLAGLAGFAAGVRPIVPLPVVAAPPMQAKPHHISQILGHSKQTLSTPLDLSGPEATNNERPSSPTGPNPKRLKTDEENK